MRLRKNTWQREAFSRDRTDGGGGGDDFDVDDDTKDDGDDGTDDDGDDDDDTDDEDDDAPLNSEGKPVTKKDWEAVNKALRAARREARQARRGRNKTDDGKDDKTDDGTDDKADETRIRAEAENAAMQTWKPVVVNERARAALKDAGLIGDPGRVLRLLDMDDIDVDLDDSGKVTVDGLTEQVEDLRKDYPHLFRKRGSRRIDAGDRDEINEKRKGKRSASEIQADVLLGRL